MKSQQRARSMTSMKTSILLGAAFLSLGFLSACSSNNQVAREVIENKQATAEKVHRSYQGEVRAGHSIWNLSRKEN